MQNCIADIRQWMLQDRPRLNDDKTEFIIIAMRQQLAKVNIDSLQVGESSTAPGSKVKNLGCWFDGQLKVIVQFETEGSGRNEIVIHMDRSEIKP